MLNRRVFLEAGAATGALCWLARAAGSSGAPIVPAPDMLPPLYCVVVDERFDASAGFRAVVAAGGCVVRGVRGDVTDLWFYELAPRWRELPAPIAGLTGAGALFCLERLAWDAGLRVVYRAEHRPLTDGRMRHRLCGSAPALAPARSLASAQGDWNSRIAELVLACPRQPPSRLSSMTLTGASAAAADAAPLYSWLIAARAPRNASPPHGDMT